LSEKDYAPRYTEYLRFFSSINEGSSIYKNRVYQLKTQFFDKDGNIRQQYMDKINNDLTLGIREAVLKCLRNPLEDEEIDILEIRNSFIDEKNLRYSVYLGA